MNDDVINLISSSEDESESEPPQKIPAQAPEPVLQMMQTLLKGMPIPVENLKEVKVEKQTAKVKKQTAATRKESASTWKSCHSCVNHKLWKQSCESRPQYDAAVCTLLLLTTISCISIPTRVANRVANRVPNRVPNRVLTRDRERIPHRTPHLL